MSPDDFAAIGASTRARGLKVHLDGARLFNAAVALGVSADAWGRHTDTVSICLSKGLGAPVGSVLCGSKGTIDRARRFRKMMGGGMRQAGIIAAAGLYALEHHIDGLADDHRRARALAQHLAGLAGASIRPDDVVTNIVIFDVEDSASAVCEAVADDVLILPVGPKSVRAVFHRDVDDDGLARALAALSRVLG